MLTLTQKVDLYHQQDNGRDQRSTNRPLKIRFLTAKSVNLGKPGLCPAFTLIRVALSPYDPSLPQSSST